MKKEGQISAGEAVKEKKAKTSERQKGGEKIVTCQYCSYYTCVSALIYEGVSGFGLSHFQHKIHILNQHTLHKAGFFQQPPPPDPALHSQFDCLILLHSWTPMGL